MGELQPYLTIRSLGDGNSLSSGDSAYASGSSDYGAPSTTHDISRVSYHVKHLDSFAKTLEESANKAFPNRGRPTQRYQKVIALMLHWKSDDLFVLPELEDLEKCFREEYGFETDIFAIPSDNAHLELMLRLAAMVKEHESNDTLFIVYYGGHARIDESRQSTWCATRNPSSPSLQWSAIQTLLERSMSDTLILLDCCAGAASATFPNGKSITETISASSWDAIAPDPGRYSFTSTLIEVLQDWQLRTFSAAMLHAEVLARLKHPRPIAINGKMFEARSTPVHFMMTSNHRAPSIEIGRVLPKNKQLPSPPVNPMYNPVYDPLAASMGYMQQPMNPMGYANPMRPVNPMNPMNPMNHMNPMNPVNPMNPMGPMGPMGSMDPMNPMHSMHTQPVAAGVPSGRGPQEEAVKDPNEDEPHVMISLALEEDQSLDLNAWEQWLASFPALAKYVKVQGVFKSHSTLLLLSVPVMVWDMLPENQACSFVAFIRSNNLLKEQNNSRPESVATPQPAAQPASNENDIIEPERSGEPPSEHTPQPEYQPEFPPEYAGPAEHQPEREVERGPAPEPVPEAETGIEPEISEAEDIAGDDEDEGDNFTDTVSINSETTFSPSDDRSNSVRMSIATTVVESLASRRSRVPLSPSLSIASSRRYQSFGPGNKTSPTVYSHPAVATEAMSQPNLATASPGAPSSSPTPGSTRRVSSATSEQSFPRPLRSSPSYGSSSSLSRTMILNQQRVARRTTFAKGQDVGEGPAFAQHIVDRLEEYFQSEPNPSVGIIEFFASNLGVETRDIELWFHRRHQQEMTKRNLQSLCMEHALPPSPTLQSGAKMILPGHLNSLLEIFSPMQVLLVDLRTPTSFDKSHIYGAVNLRIPASFVQKAFDLIKRAFTDDQSRRNYARAPTARCIIFYDRVLEYPWECPMAEALTEQLRQQHNWNGDCYVLKGHYREFSASFDKYIVGDRISQAAKEFGDSLRQRPPLSAADTARCEAMYVGWKQLVASLNVAPRVDAPGLEGKHKAVQQHEAELAAELESRNPVLFRKVNGLQQVPLKRSGSSSPFTYDVIKKETGYYEDKGPRSDLVEHLARGLDKMQEAQSSEMESNNYKKPMTTPGYDKLGELEDMGGDSDEIDPHDDLYQGDPAFVKAGGIGGMGVGGGGSGSGSGNAVGRAAVAVPTHDGAASRSGND